MKNNIESSPQEIWIRIRFLEINGSSSLVTTTAIAIVGKLFGGQYRYKYVHERNQHKKISKEIKSDNFCIAGRVITLQGAAAAKN